MDDGVMDQGLDLGQLPMTPQPAQAPAKRNRWSEFAPLLAMLPIAASKGGQAGVAALLGGMQQAQRDRQVQQMRDEQMGLQRQQIDAQAQARDAAARSQAEQARQRQAAELLTGLSGALGDIESQEDARLLLEAIGPDLDRLGLRARAEGLVQRSVKGIPQRQAKRILDTLGTVPLDRRNEKMVIIDGVPKSYNEIAAAANGVQPGVTITTPPKAASTSDELPNELRSRAVVLLTRIRQAEANGDEATASELRAQYDDVVKAQRDVGQADDRPPQAYAPGMDPRINARVDRLTGRFDSHPIVKEFNEVQAQSAIINDIVNGNWSGPGDLAVVFAFMKALDPTSVVRESEYDNASKAGNIFAGWAARFNGAVNPSGGFLSEQVRRDFLKTIQSRMAIKGKQYENLRRQMTAKIDRIYKGAPETADEAVFDYGAAFPGNGDGTSMKIGRFTVEVEQP